MFNPGLRPACLPTSFEIPDRMIATGWGYTLYADDTSAATHLQKVVLDKFTRDECNSAYKVDSNGFPHGLQSSQFCVGNRDTTTEKDTCQGDSGGPLQSYHPSLTCLYVLYGITSTGQGCGIAGVPGLYIQIWSYIDWIENNVWG